MNNEEGKNWGPGLGNEEKKVNSGDGSKFLSTEFGDWLNMRKEGE